jgi:hypothetical protein
MILAPLAMRITSVFVAPWIHAEHHGPLASRDELRADFACELRDRGCVERRASTQEIVEPAGKRLAVLVPREAGSASG